MRKNLLLTFLLLFNLFTTFAQLGIGTTTPDSSAMLDVYSTNKGFLPPRIALTANNIAAPVINPATGLLIYNTATAGISPNNITPGYYYWNGSIWYPITNKGNAPGDMQYWNGAQWINIPLGANGSVLTLCNGVPRWGGCDSTLALSPVNNPNESSVYSYNPTGNGVGTQEIDIAAWTNGGNAVYLRTYVKFDFTIPTNATVMSAKLSLYAIPNPQAGNMVDAHYGTANSMSIQRITSAWSGATINWNNQPSTTTTNQVILPTTTSSFQNDVDIDVTQLVKDMQQNGNNGFAMRLVAENYYNIRQYVSSYHSDVAKHPKLVITYKF